ncbi:MAG: CCA tRNA nucleotidyltransferase, partial [Thermoplasmata archaeon]|nr:CCA tRNA nucleotidyltransferase [Thermoplasmata archaeon]
MSISKNNNFRPILDKVLGRVSPSREQCTEIDAVVRKISEKALAMKSSLGVEFEIVHVGSTAKDTHLDKGDIDLFFRFDPSVPEKTLQGTIFSIGKAILSRYRIQYAEHPYIRGEMHGFDIDLVPCFGVESGARIISAVDRTPFHTSYIISHLSDAQRGEVRLLKQFLKGIGCYGAENRTMGLSGYLSELLILHYGDFLTTLQAASHWMKKTLIDIEEQGYTGSDEAKPLLVVDPVDPGRNVASAVSDEKIAMFIHAAREFLSSPSLKFFFPPPQPIYGTKELRDILDVRGKMLFITFGCPNVIDDILYPQLRATLQRFQRMFKEHGFLLNDSGFTVHDSIYLFFEFRIKGLPENILHKGPMVYMEDHEKKFLEKWSERSP